MFQGRFGRYGPFPPGVERVADDLERFLDEREAQAALAKLRQRSERLPGNERAWLEAHAGARFS
jgi:hypothetical protein